jgi:hypothetical protein
MQSECYEIAAPFRPAGYRRPEAQQARHGSFPLVRKTPPRFVGVGVALGFLIAVWYALLVSNRLKDIIEYFFGPYVR